MRRDKKSASNFPNLPTFNLEEKPPSGVGDKSPTDFDKYWL
jgi:hypothetical protein